MDTKKELLIAFKAYIKAVDNMNMAMKDGVNVHGAISELIAAEEMAGLVISKADNE